MVLCLSQGINGPHGTEFSEQNDFGVIFRLTLHERIIYTFRIDIFM